MQTVGMTMLPPHLRTILDASPSAALVVESDGVIRYANQAARLQLDRGEIVGGSLTNFLSFTAAAPLDHANLLHATSSWEEAIEPNSFIDDIKTVNGVNIQYSIDFYSAAITLARINVGETPSDPHATSGRSGNPLVDQYLYCLYIHGMTKEMTRRHPPEKGFVRQSLQNDFDESPNSFRVNSLLFQENGASPEAQDTTYQIQSLDHHSISLAALDASFHALFVINELCAIQMVNPRSSEVFGWTQEEFIGQKLNIIMSHDVATLYDKYFKEYFKKGETTLIGNQNEVTARRKDGSTFPAALTLAHPQGRASSLICVLIRDLSTEKAAQELLVHEQMLTSGIIDASFDGLFVISDRGVIQRVNKASCKLFGWSEEEFIGQNINMIMPKHHAERHDSYLSQYMQTGVRRIIGKERELEACRKDGTTFTCTLGLAEVVTNETTTQFVGFVRDVTLQKEALKAVKEEQNLISKILDASFDSLLVINEKGIIQRVNEAAIRTFGWTREEFIGTNINIIMPPLHAAKHDSYIQKYLATGFKKMIGKQREVESLHKDGSTFPCTLGLAEVSHKGSKLFVGFVKDVTIQKELLIANAEREASDTLLYNILPVHIANRLKQDPGHIADHYENTTILFADIVGFTDRTSKMTPHDVVTMLNDLFSRFDYLVGIYDLNKVKTIGDCYMVSSIPSSEIENDGCARVCRFALDLMKAVQGFNNAGPQHGHVTLRVGISCGSVVAGVVGTKRYLFDVWGDAVNVAARMEQHGVPGQIQVTQSVVHNAGNEFSFESRGMIHLKGKGPMEAFILKSAKSIRHQRSVYDPYAMGFENTPCIRASSNYL
eukprot:CCRYP_005004-RA/>CCRYP_005004-RA protein AED:0.03 eAED:0.03 QI:363/1/1/1/0.26/0.18/16/9071/831